RACATEPFSRAGSPPLRSKSAGPVWRPRYSRGVRASDRLLLFVAPAALLASVDQVVKATVTTPWWAFHHRSQGWVALSIGLLIAALFLTRVPSRAVAVAGGVMSAGVIGNLVSARWDANYVPNPLVIGGYGHGFAFNLADVFF